MLLILHILATYEIGLNSLALRASTTNDIELYMYLKYTQTQSKHVLFYEY